MAFKTISVIITVFLISQVTCRDLQKREARNIIEERLDDVIRDHITNPLIGISISIPHSALDTLEECIVLFPNGLTYQVFPFSNLPVTVIPSTSVFPECSIGFRGISVDMSGTYELTALTSHADGRRTIQRRRFILNITEGKEW